MINAKAPAADLDWPIDFSPQLAGGETIVGVPVWSITLTGGRATGAGDLAVVGGSSALLTGSIATCLLTGGVLGTVYEVTCTATTSAARKPSSTMAFRICPAEPT